MAFNKAEYWKDYYKKNAGRWTLKRTPIAKKAKKIEDIKPVSAKKHLKEKSLSDLISLAETLFNAFIRGRDTDRFGMICCISCNTRFKASMMHAGHYLPAGNNSSVRFDEINVNGQCPICNLDKHGNQKSYRVGLIEKYSLEIVEELELRAKYPFKWDRFELLEIIDKYRQLCNNSGKEIKICK